MCNLCCLSVTPLMHVKRARVLQSSEIFVKKMKLFTDKKKKKKPLQLLLVYCNNWIDTVCKSMTGTNPMLGVWSLD